MSNPEAIVQVIALVRVAADRVNAAVRAEPFVQDTLDKALLEFEAANLKLNEMGMWLEPELPEGPQIEDIFTMEVSFDHAAYQSSQGRVLH